MIITLNERRIKEGLAINNNWHSSNRIAKEREQDKKRMDNYTPDPMKQ